MTKWYQNKYIQALGVAVATGLVAALAVYLATMTDGMDMRHTIKTVGTAFLGPFAVLVSVLPKITDLIVPTVKIEAAGGASVQRLAALAAGEDDNTTVTTSDAVTTIVVTPTPRLRKNPDANGVAVVQPEADKGAVT